MVHIIKFNESISIESMTKKPFDKLEWFSNITNRSKRQTEMLYDLVGGNWDKLKELELKIRIGHIQYCPSSKKEVNEILEAPLVRFLTDEYFEEYMDNFWTIKKRIKNFR